MKQIVVFDFDGVIHSYKSGWQGEDIISDPPVPGIREAIAEIRADGYEVVVVSTRCATPKGYGAIRAWLMDFGIEVDDVKTEKPPAIAYIDDRAIYFDGHPENLLGRIKSLKPWNKSSTTNADRIRSMSDEDLATFISEIAGDCENNTASHQHCYGCEIEYCDYRMCLNWLQQPADGE